MIKIEDKKDCCGCSACVGACPRSCIILREDHEGFVYPQIDENACIQCGLCNKVCPIENPTDKHTPKKVFASKNSNENIREKSSSGGVFTALAEYVITHKHGVVFGAKFDDEWNVVHDYTETIEGLSAFRGSKYVQSKINGIFKQVEAFLKQDRFVLFSGTPCQVHGLLLYLRKKYSNLLTVDFVCHGVPSPKVWRLFVDEITNSYKDGKTVLFPLNSRISERNAHVKSKEDCIENISFRDKRFGWKKFSFALTFSKPSGADKKKSVSFSHIYYYHPYMMGFINNLYLRPSCFDCKAKSFCSGSDITLADFWGIQNVCPEIDDDRGVSAVIIHTQQAVGMFSLLQLDNMETDVETFTKYNAYAVRSAKPHPHREMFFHNLNGCKSITALILQHTLTRMQRIKRHIKLMLNKYKFIEL